MGQDSARRPRKTSGEYSFADRRDLWCLVEELIKGGDLLVCDRMLVWFQDPADAITQDVGRLLTEWRGELIEIIEPAPGPTEGV